MRAHPCPGCGSGAARSHRLRARPGLGAARLPAQGGSSARSVAPRCGRAGRRGQPAEERSEEDVSAAAPPRPRAALSRAEQPQVPEGPEPTAPPPLGGSGAGEGGEKDAAARLFPLCARAEMGCGGCWGGEAAAPLRVSPAHPSPASRCRRLPRRPRPAVQGGPGAAPVTGCAGPGRAGAAPLRALGVGRGCVPLPAAAGRGEGREAAQGCICCRRTAKKGRGGINKKTFSLSL